MSDLQPHVLVGRIANALAAAHEVFRHYEGRDIAEESKTGGDPLTEVDVALDLAIRESLSQDGEGWLSEETADDLSRLDRQLVWIVDPLDGTREFIDGLAEYCTSVAAVLNGVPVAGGIMNPAANVTVIGAVGLGLTCNGASVDSVVDRSRVLSEVLASRSEVGRGQWAPVEQSGIKVTPMGSVAYKMARVSAGLDDVTWTPVPKHEWDVAGGAALLSAAGGRATGLNGEALRFNQERPWFSGVIALRPGLEAHLDSILEFVELQAAIS